MGLHLPHARDKSRHERTVQINNFGTSTLDMKLGGPSSSASCRVALQVGTVAKNDLSPSSK